MKSLLCALLMFLGSECYSQSSNRVLVETLKCETPFFDRIDIRKNNFDGPGSFHQVEIFHKNKLIYSIEDDFDSLYIDFQGLKNLVRSDLIFLYNLNDDYFINLIGFQFGCCLPKLIVIKSNHVGIEKIFDKEFGVEEIRRESEKTVLINGQPALSHGLVPADTFVVVSYAPHHIYRLEKKLVLDSALTISWNKENYVFRGFQASGDVWIAQPTRRSKRQFKAYVFKEKDAKPPKLDFRGPRD